MRRKIRFLTMVLTLATVAAGVDPPDGEGVMNKVSGVLARLRDLQADVTVQTSKKQAAGSIVLEYVRKDGDAQQSESRMRRYKVVTRTRVRGQTVRVTQINDGDYLWAEVKSLESGKVSVTRRKIKAGAPVPGGLGLDFRRRFGDMRKRFAFQTVGTGTYRDEPVVLIQGTRKKEADAGVQPDEGGGVPRRVDAYVSSRDDFPRRVVLVMGRTASKALPERQTQKIVVELLNVKLNKGLKPDTFAYRIPPGAAFREIK